MERKKNGRLVPEADMQTEHDFAYRGGPHDHLWQSSKAMHGYADGPEVARLELVDLAKDMGVYHGDEIAGQAAMLTGAAMEVLERLSPAQENAILRARRTTWAHAIEDAKWVTCAADRTEEILVERGLAHFEGQSRAICVLNPLAIVIHRILLDIELDKLAKKGIVA